MTASARAAVRQGGWLPDVGAPLVPQQVSVGPGRVEGEGWAGWAGCGRRARPVLSRPGLGGTGTRTPLESRPGPRSPHHCLLASWRPLPGQAGAPLSLGPGHEADIPGLVWRRERCCSCEGRACICDYFPKLSRSSRLRLLTSHPRGTAPVEVSGRLLGAQKQGPQGPEKALGQRGRNRCVPGARPSAGPACFN